MDGGECCGEWIMPKECVLVSTARRRNTTPARRSARGPRARPSASSGSRPLPPLSAYRTTPRNPFWRCGRCGSSRCATSYTMGANGARVPLSEQARAPLQLQPATGRGLGPQRRGSLHGHPRAIRVIDKTVASSHHTATPGVTDTQPPDLALKAPQRFWFW